MKSSRIDGIFFEQEFEFAESGRRIEILVESFGQHEAEFGRMSRKLFGGAQLGDGLGVTSLGDEGCSNAETGFKEKRIELFGLEKFATGFFRPFFSE